MAVVDAEQIYAALREHKDALAETQLRAMSKGYVPDSVVKAKRSNMDRRVRLALGDPNATALQRERLRQRMTLRELATRAKLSRTTVYGAEKRNRETRPATYKRLARALKVPVSDILP